MESTKTQAINIISKLMDEEDSFSSTLKSVYENLYSIVEEKLPEILDKGAYIDNASIVRRTNELLDEKSVFVLAPELAGRTVISLWGDSKLVGEIFEKASPFKLGIELNSNLPLLMIPVKNRKKNSIYAITYTDRLIQLSFDEFFLITKEMYKTNIDIRKLIKSFVMYYPNNNIHQVYWILPQYFSRDNDFYGIIDKLSDYQLLITDDNNQWKKMVDKLFLKDVILLGEQNDLNYLEGKLTNKVTLKSIESFNEICYKLNFPCINFATEIEFRKIFSEVLIFYYNKRKEFDEKRSKLAEDSIHSKNNFIKSKVKDYRKRIIERSDSLEEAYEFFVQIVNKILNQAIEFEKSNWNLLSESLNDDINSEKYVASLVTVFFQSIYAGELESAKDIILRLTRMRYTYVEALNYLLIHEQGFELMNDAIGKINKYTNDCAVIAKIKMILSKELGLKVDDLKKIACIIDPLETGKEYYYYGKWLLDQKEYISATKFFQKALDSGYDKAGVELIKLAAKHPECKIDIESLAENLVAEANFYIGKESISGKYKKGVVNLKMAASQKHLKSIEMIADLFFDKYKYIHWKDMDAEENKDIIYNIISLYDFLDGKKSKQKYQLRKGLMFCKLKDYVRAFSLLKNIEEDEARYECAKMYQYGNGVARDLKKAKWCYENMKNEYRDSKERYNKVCILIQKEGVKQTRKSYDEHEDYSSKSYRSSYSTGGCFITTSACLALLEKEDCEQLNELRRFRDRHILGDGEDGDDLVSEYYRVAPILIQHINQEPDSYSIYMELWDNYILPSYDMIRGNQHKEAKQKYIAMVKFLCHKYRVTVKENIMKKYDIRI